MITETVRQAFQAIIRNAMRSFLTILGVIIGVAAVITMVTIGQGSTDQIESDVSKLGTNLLIVRPGAGMGPRSSGRSSSDRRRSSSAAGRWARPGRSIFRSSPRRSPPA